MVSDEDIKNSSGQLRISFDKKLSQLLMPDEIYQLADQKLLSELLEDKRIERKPVTIRSEHLAEYFSMWSNTDPFGGIIVVGYRKDNVLEGCLAFGQDRTNEIEKCGHTHCPDARFASKRIGVTNYKSEEDYVILIRVPYREDKLVKTVAGKAYDRRADTKHELNSEEMREVEIEKGQISFETEPCNLPYPAAFETKLIEAYASSYKASRQISPEHSDEEILKITHLGKIEHAKFIPNNACALLFAKDPQEIFPGCKIRFLRFSGEEEHSGEKWNVEKDEWIDTGSIPYMLAKAERVLTAQLRVFSRLEKDGRFYSAPEYPNEAWSEAMINACAHRSYEQRGMTIFVKMFDDRLVVESPGGFPPFVTPENIYEMHKPRNPHLMAAMFYFDLVKCANEGTRRMRDSMQKLNLPSPEFEEKQLGARIVRVTLRNDVRNRRKWIDKGASDVVGKTVWLSLNEDERKIVNYMAEYKLVSVSDVQRLIGRSWPTCSKILKNLKSRGILTDVRKSRGSRDPQSRWKLAGKE